MGSPRPASPRSSAKGPGTRRRAPWRAISTGIPATNNGVAALAPDVLRLAAGGDAAAGEAVSDSVLQLLALAVSVTRKAVPGKRPDTFRAGVSGHILNHPFAFQALSSKAPFPLSRVTEPPIEGVRLLLARDPVSGRPGKSRAGYAPRATSAPIAAATRAPVLR